VFRRLWHFFCLSMGISTPEDKQRVTKWMGSGRPTAAPVEGDASSNTLQASDSSSGRRSREGVEGNSSDGSDASSDSSQDVGAFDAGSGDGGGGGSDG